MILLDGKKAATHYKEALMERAKNFEKKCGRKVTLQIFKIGDNPASTLYVNNKIKFCERIGVRGVLRQMPENITQKDLIRAVEEANRNPEIDGMIVQSPLPPTLNFDEVMEHVNPEKDVDGLTYINQGKMLHEHPCHLPATPKGVQLLLKYYDIDPYQKHVVVVGRSKIVGSPMAVLMSREAAWSNATVTICHNETVDLGRYTRLADILIVAVGEPNLITAGMVKKGVTVVDVGINKIEDKHKKGQYKIVGDTDFETISKKAHAISPVPGGVGPMTITGLLFNTINAAEQTTSSKI